MEILWLTRWVRGSVSSEMMEENSRGGMPSGPATFFFAAISRRISRTVSGCTCSRWKVPTRHGRSTMGVGTGCGVPCCPIDT